MSRSSIVLFAALLLFGGVSWSDSLFSSETAARGTLISDNKMRFEVGDLVTVLVRETIDAQTDSDLETAKESTIEATAAAAANAFLTGGDGLIDFKPGELPNWSIEIENEHEAEGTTLRRNRLTATVTCVVTRVFPNGNIQLEGQKRVTVNREDTFLVVSGIARARDVTAENVVNSNQLASAIFDLKGEGPLWNNQRRGILTRILDWISPF